VIETLPEDACWNFDSIAAHLASLPLAVDAGAMRMVPARALFR
jgi:hypothetical protein